jgi:hypothetical protein
VTIKFAAAVDMSELLTYVSGNADPHADVPRAAIQVLEVVMRSGVAGGWVGGGRLGLVCLWCLLW